MMSISYQLLGALCTRTCVRSGTQHIQAHITIILNYIEFNYVFYTNHSGPDRDRGGYEVMLIFRL